MKYFWETTETIVKGVGFTHFKGCHWIWLALFVLTCTLLTLFYRQSSPTRRLKIRRVLAALLVADELFKIVCLAAGGNYTPKYLPLHLCSINIILIAVHAWKPSKTLDNFLYVICIPTALLALLFPTWTKLPPANFMHLHSFSVHILLAAYPIVLTLGGDIKPSVRALPRCLLLLLGFGVLALLANHFFDTNFMFLSSASKGNPLYWFKQALGSHLWGFPILAPVLVTVMYLPPYLIRKIKTLKKP